MLHEQKRHCHKEVVKMDPITIIFGLIAAFVTGLIADPIIESIGMNESPPPFDMGWNL